MLKIKPISGGSSLMSTPNRSFIQWGGYPNNESLLKGRLVDMISGPYNNEEFTKNIYFFGEHKAPGDHGGRVDENTDKEEEAKHIVETESKFQAATKAFADRQTPIDADLAAKRVVLHAAAAPTHAAAKKSRRNDYARQKPRGYVKGGYTCTRYKAE